MCRIACWAWFFTEGFQRFPLVSQRKQQAAAAVEPSRNVSRGDQEAAGAEHNA